MKTTAVGIGNDSINAFINALDEVGCGLVSEEPFSYYMSRLVVSYEYPHNLFYLAAIMEINKKMEEFNTTLK